MNTAVPLYVLNAADNFADCPPGHRFSLYFPLWNGGWTIDNSAKAQALRQSLNLGSAAAPLNALIARQLVLAEALPENRCLVIDALSSAPFATGLGLEHPIENGFAFLSPYGLPYLAGSGVKGVLRRAAEELNAEAVLALFGPDTEDIRKPEDARCGALTCWDVFPHPPENELAVEIMTPHYGDYYQGNSSPHDAGKPNPIPFLAVPAGSAFRFVVTCEPSLLPGNMRDNWKLTLEAIIKHAFDWLGFGAKTAVGYGAMVWDDAAKQARLDCKAKQLEATRRASLSEAAKAIDDLRAKFARMPSKEKQPGGPVYGAMREVMTRALVPDSGWTDAEKRELAALCREQSKSLLTLGSKEKEIKVQWRQLEGES